MEKFKSYFEMAITPDLELLSLFFKKVWKMRDFHIYKSGKYHVETYLLICIYKYILFKFTLHVNRYIKTINSPSQEMLQDIIKFPQIETHLRQL